MMELTNIHKSFYGVEVLRGVDLTLHDRERLTVIGMSGAGKSVLLKTAIGLLEPDAGKIVLDGKDITDLTEAEMNHHVRPKISMVFQNSALWDSMTVYSNVELALTLKKHLSADERRELVHDSLELLELGEAANKYPAELSGGMRKRTAIARAIAARPSYLLYDEPTTGLDPVLAEMVIEMIKRLNDELDVTALLVSHDIQRIPEFSDRVAMLHDGRIVTTCPADEIWENDDRLFSSFIRGKGGPFAQERQ